MASDEYDLEAIQCICEYWITASAVRKDFELSKVKYKIPSPFFLQQPKLTSLQQSLENIPHLLLESPEACHLLPSSETVLGDDLYVMTRLNKLIDALPSSKSNVKLYDRPLTPFEGMIKSIIKSLFTYYLLILAPNMITINSFSSNPLIQSSCVFSSANYVALQNKKFGELSEYCTNLLAKMPKGLSKDQINDKVKKNGGLNIYNSWISNELTQLCNVISIVKSHLTVSLKI
jgi:dynein heavy chain